MLHRSTSNLPLSHRSTSPSSCSSLSAPLFLPDPPATTLSLCFQTTATTNLAFDQKSTIWGDFAQVHSDYLLKQPSSAFVFSGLPVTFTLVLKYNLIWSILVFECASNHCQKDNAHIEAPELYICTQINETPITSMSLSPTCVRIERIFVKVSFEAVFRAGSYSYQLTAGGKNSLLGRRRRRKGDDKIEFLEKRWRSTSWPSTSCWWSGWEEHCWRNAMMTTMFVRSIGWHCPPLQKWPWMELNSATRSWWWFYVWGLCQSNILSGYKSSSNVFPIFLWRSNKTPHISVEIK